MGKSTKWLILAISLILIGGIIFCGMMTILKWDFSKLSTTKYETNNYEIEEDFSSILVDSSVADIKFVATDNAKCQVECFEQKNLSHSVKVTDDKLEIKVNDTRKWYEHIGFYFKNPKITVYLPKAQYSSLNIKQSTGDVEISKDFSFSSIDISVSTGDVKCYSSATETIKIKTSTGDILVENLNAFSLDLSVTTGKVTVSSVEVNGEVKVKVSTGKANLSSVNCNSVVSSGNTGDITLNSVIAKDGFSIERTTGDVKFIGCDASQIFVKTDTGDVLGTLKSSKIFIAKTSTGKIDVPETQSGGVCEITTTTGDVKIEIG